MMVVPPRVALITALHVGALVPLPVNAQQEVAVRQIFASDSVDANRAQLSPDGRWLAMRVAREDGGGSIWMAPAGGGAPFRVTSDGYDDFGMLWFRSGDRLAIMTNRFNRNGSRASYLAVQGIDPVTGRAVGVPRQVSTEAISRGGASSPDGRWLLYVNAGTPAYIKIIPSSGGTARILAPAAQLAGNLAFGPDSRWVYYEETDGRAGERRFALKRVATAGGTVETVTSGSHPVSVLPADPRYLIHEVAFDPQRYELRTQAGDLVGTLSLPRGMREGTYSGDGWGIMGMQGGWTGSVRVVSTDGGQSREIVSGGRHWPEAWMPDGSAIITDRPDGDGTVFEAITLDGRITARTGAPARSTQTGWHNSVGPWMSSRVVISQPGQAVTDALYAVNVLSGERREISRTSVRVRFSARGGMEQDGERWVYVQRGTSGRLELRSTDPATGNSSLVYAFPADHQFTADARLLVNGNRVAYTQLRGDSLELHQIDVTSGRQRKLASFSREAGSAAWSWDGTQIAVADWLPGTPRRGVVHLVSVPSGTTEVPTIRNLDLGQENYCDLFMWTRDDSHMVMLCYGSNDRILKLRLSDGQVSTVLSGDQPQRVWEYLLSPDGRSVAYTVQRDAGSSVHVASFRSLVEAHARR